MLAQISMNWLVFARALTLGCLACLAGPVACGDSESGSRSGAGGSSAAAGAEGISGEPTTGASGGGSDPEVGIPGTATTSKTISCGAAQCSSVRTLLPTLFVDPCCAADGACGVATEFLAGLGETCQASNQPGAPDGACPSSAAQKLPVNGRMFEVEGFSGCCRTETGTCGVVVNRIVASGLPFASPMLGCVDSAPFFGGKTAAACGDPSGGGGAGGATSAAGGAGGSAP